MHAPFLLWEIRTMVEGGRGFLEEMRNKMRQKRGLVERKLREKSEMMVASSIQLTAGKEGFL